MYLQDLPVEMSQHELLAYLGRTLPVSTYLEVGVRDGCTLWVMIESALETIRLVACSDTWTTDHGGTGRSSHEHIDRLLHAISYFHYGREALWLDGRSQLTLPGLIGKHTFDLVHIDGSHDYADALEDFRNGWALTSQALVAHDLKYGPVLDAWKKFLSDVPVPSHRIFTGGHGTAVALTRSLI
jgi:hypothetical protein